ncbi:MAG: zinc ABC transporter permease AztB [Nitriliruptorales bacterium]|nr:zinc ABC transporter permease AztB [Nitriliruptorales bacterium]
MDALIDPFLDNAFMQRALVAGLLTVVSTSVVGTWVVLRGLTFLGDALAHGVIPGIALAFLLEINLGVGAAVAALVMLGGIDLVSRRSRLPQDVGIGLLFVGMLALGVIIISLRGAYAGDLTAILFGDAIGVSVGDVVTSAGVTVVVVAVAALLHRPFLVLTFSREKAAVLGLRPRVTHAVMLVLVGLAIVASFRAVGTLLVFAFLVAPPAAASLFARRVPAMMGVAVALGWTAVVIGLLVSFHAGTPASATIAMAAVVEFFAVLVVRGVVEGARAKRGVVAT